MCRCLQVRTWVYVGLQLSSVQLGKEDCCACESAIYARLRGDTLLTLNYCTDHKQENTLVFSAHFALPIGTYVIQLSRPSVERIHASCLHRCRSRCRATCRTMTSNESARDMKSSSPALAKTDHVPGRASGRLLIPLLDARSFDFVRKRLGQIAAMGSIPLRRGG